MKRRWSIPALVAVLAAVSGCAGKGTRTAVSDTFKRTIDGKPVRLYTLVNKNGMEARITNYGGILVSLKAPGRDGKVADVVLGYDSLQKYLDASPYFGCIVGRYGNRIGGARFSLGGSEYRLAANDGNNSLHGGKRGFDKVVWAAEGKTTSAGPALVLKYTSADGEEGFPGRLECTVTYALTNNDELRIEYEAVTDSLTVVNLTHHSYFNLDGAGKGNILDHLLMMNADRFTPVDENLIPTGELRPVRDTPFDFTTPVRIGARIDGEDEQLMFGKGYDHNWVLRNQGGSLSLAASAYSPQSGRAMEVWTTEPGIQFYSGNFLDGSQIGKGGISYGRRHGFCLESQHYPDSPNKPAFPSASLEPGQTYRTTTIYKFLVR